MPATTTLALRRRLHMIAAMDALRGEHGRDFNGARIVVEWARGPKDIAPRDRYKEGGGSRHREDEYRDRYRDDDRRDHRREERRYRSRSRSPYHSRKRSYSRSPDHGYSRRRSRSHSRSPES